eukprot:CAMPEP_0167743064 /NCGR_PEP_ID=MMETSP0110_2-20121227/1800_1 /TAXON_ID=629695 /ORGANISM="Gymnochlora sp., Strain CCMP2014" /LENGTH=253 /DNA_ID=CAMNT_0007627377 /DNA_START=45 /DNA_END=806 /DNA_ORIENTATION=-
MTSSLIVLLALNGVWGKIDARRSFLRGVRSSALITSSKFASPTLTRATPTPDRSSASANVEDITSAREFIRNLRLGSNIADSDKTVANAINTLLQDKSPSNAVDKTISDFDWNGSWRVVYAPHLSFASQMLLGTKFDVEYAIDDETMQSNVRVTSDILPLQYWLCSAGSVTSAGPRDCKIKFNEFWVEPLTRATIDAPPPKPDLSGGNRFLINAMGKLGFLEDLALFPVLWMDESLCVFRFPALNVVIAARKE